MTIDKLGHTPGTSPVPEGKSPRGGARPGPAAGTRVELSRISAKLDELKASLAEAPADPGRVEEIRQAIAEGRFRVNAEAVAEHVLDAARELLQAQKGAK